MDQTQPNQSPQPPLAPQLAPDVASQESGRNEVNVYPMVRHLFLILCALLAVAIILFLFYQNGKSIYDNGI